MEKYPTKKKPLLIVSLVSNLAILFFFKYYNFFVGTIDFYCNLFGAKNKAPYFNVLLPVGISFYTFQALGYSIDVYKGKIAAEKNFITYALFVTFFPQLVAGPIERTSNLLPQFKADNNFNYERVTDGLKLAAWGFFQKLVVADQLAIYVNYVFNNVDSATGCSIILATFFFCFQVLCDFAGYSNIAIGCAKVLGFNLMCNFKRPFFSKSIQELWTHWHISLSTWFKDYLFIPLGGSRVGMAKRCFNIFVVFAISGIWHGAAWHYVVWGILHAIFQIVGILAKPLRIKTALVLKLAVEDSSVKSGIRTKRPWQFVQMFITFLLFAFAALFFRANNMLDAGIILSKFIHFPSEIISTLKSSNIEELRNCFILTESISGYGIKNAIFAFSLIAILLLVDFITRKTDGLTLIRKQAIIIRWFCYYVLVAAIIFLSVGGKSEFVYFQF